MGEYMGYVLTAYGAAFAIIGFMVMTTMLKRRRLRKKEKETASLT